MFHRHPFIVKNSDESKRYIVICRCGCPWIVRARRNGNTQRITTVAQPHTCSTKVDDIKHPQLSSRFISEKVVHIIKSCQRLIVVTLIEVVMVSWGYCVKYGRAWWAKQRALKLIYGDWFEAYERLLTMLHAMKAKNPKMHFEYIPKPKIFEPDGRRYFFHAFKHSCDVLFIDGMFLIRKYEGTLLIDIGIDADCQLVPLAFVTVEKENNGSCD
jgi:hypothetical protein